MTVHWMRWERAHHVVSDVQSMWPSRRRNARFDFNWCDKKKFRSLKFRRHTVGKAGPLISEAPFFLAISVLSDGIAQSYEEYRSVMWFVQDASAAASASVADSRGALQYWQTRSDE